MIDQKPVAMLGDAERAREKRDLDERIKLLRSASRTAEPLTGAIALADGRSLVGPSAQGHILSALTELERRRALLG